MNNPFIDVLFTYDSWANQRLFEECLNLTPEQLQRPLGLGHGNIDQTLRHMIGATIFFADRLNRRQPRPRPDRDNIPRTAEELFTLFETADEELHEAISRTFESHSLSDVLNWTDEDLDTIDPLDQVPYTIVVAQMIDHSIHHRTQVIDMLKLLGIDTTTMEWHPFEWDEATRSQS